MLERTLMSGPAQRDALLRDRRRGSARSSRGRTRATARGGARFFGLPSSQSASIARRRRPLASSARSLVRNSSKARASASARSAAQFQACRWLTTSWIVQPLNCVGAREVGVGERREHAVERLALVTEVQRLLEHEALLTRIRRARAKTRRGSAPDRVRLDVMADLGERRCRVQPGRARRPFERRVHAIAGGGPRSPRCGPDAAPWSRDPSGGRAGHVSSR